MIWFSCYGCNVWMLLLMSVIIFGYNGQFFVVLCYAGCLGCCWFGCYDAIMLVVMAVIRTVVRLVVMAGCYGGCYGSSFLSFLFFHAW